MSKRSSEEEDPAARKRHNRSHTPSPQLLIDEDISLPDADEEIQSSSRAVYTWPPEVWLEVTKYCSKRDRVSLSSTSFHLRQLFVQQICSTATLSTAKELLEFIWDYQPWQSDEDEAHELPTQPTRCSTSFVAACRSISIEGMAFGLDRHTQFEVILRLPKLLSRPSGWDSVTVLRESFPLEAEEFVAAALWEAEMEAPYNIRRLNAEGWLLAPSTLQNCDFETLEILRVDRRELDKPLNFAYIRRLKTLEVSIQPSRCQHAPRRIWKDLPLSPSWVTNQCLVDRPMTKWIGCFPLSVMICSPLMKPLRRLQTLRLTCTFKDYDIYLILDHLTLLTVPLWAAIWVWHQPGKPTSYYGERLATVFHSQFPYVNIVVLEISRNGETFSFVSHKHILMRAEAEMEAYRHVHWRLPRR